MIALCIGPVVQVAGESGQDVGYSGQRTAGTGALPAPSPAASPIREAAPTIAQPVPLSPVPCTLNPVPCLPSPVPCTLFPVPSSQSSGRGIFFSFDLLTERETYEANVSDPSSSSIALMVVVRNNATAPLSVSLSASINLGGSVSLEPSNTPLLLYQGVFNVVVSVTLPEGTTSDSMGYLKINGTCDQNPTVINSLQVRLTIRQYHRAVMEGFGLSSNSPVERELLQVSCRARNLGNGPSNFRAAAYVDGRPLRIRINGNTVLDNSTVKLAAGKFFSVSASWTAQYGQHNFIIEVEDIGLGEGGNGTAAASRDSRVAGVFVGVNYKDWIPYYMVLGVALAVAGILGYKFRKKLRPKLARLKRRLRRQKGGEEEEGEEGDEGQEGEESEDSEQEPEEEEETEEDEEKPPEAPRKRPPVMAPVRPAPRKGAGTATPARASGPARAAGASRTAGRPPLRKLPPEFKRGMASVRDRSKVGVIVVGEETGDEEE